MSNPEDHNTIFEFELEKIDENTVVLLTVGAPEICCLECLRDAMLFFVKSEKFLLQQEKMH